MFLFASFVFTSCMQVVEYITKPIVSFEDGGIVVNESDYFAGGKKTSDWLFIMYMDAEEGKISSSIRTDFDEVEKGLAHIMNSDRSPKYGYSSIRVVALWDSIQPSDTRIFDLGPDTTLGGVGALTYNISNFNNFKVSESDSEIVDMSIFNSKEVDMSSNITLSTFLKWVNKHYTATNVLLHIADHGTGPGKNARAMCYDFSNSKQYMYSDTFSNALSDAGYGFGKKKLSVLLLDVCFGASMEDAYQFRNCSEYMIASPNSTPGPGFNYELIMQCFKSGNSARTISKTIGESYAKYYKDMAGLSVVPTTTVIDLSKIDACANAIDSLAQNIKDKKSSYSNYLMPNQFNMYYKGTINYLFDIGYFSYRIRNTESELSSALQDALSEAIVYSWRRSTTNSLPTKNYYEENNLVGCGITICGYAVGDGRISDWYKTDLDFGKRNNGWADMITDWFGVYY